MTVVNNASVIFKDKNGNVGKVKAPSVNDITKISTAISDVAQVVDPTSHLPINATTSSVGVVQLADSAAIAAGTSGRIVDAAQLKDAIEHVTPAGNLMTTDTAQTVTAVKTFSSLPESSVAPTTDNQLVNKKYVDDHATPLPSNLVTTDGAQTISAVKTFTALPQSSVAPSASSDLVNKAYVDGQVDVNSTYTEPAVSKGILSPATNRLTPPSTAQELAIPQSHFPGEIIISTVPVTDANVHLADGALLDGAGSYAEFVDVIAALHDADPTNPIFTDETTWQSTVTTYGECGKYVYNATANTVRIPKLTTFVQATSTASELGSLVEAGLPNITGDTGVYTCGIGYQYDPTGIAYKYREYGAHTTGSSAGGAAWWKFDASRSNPIYGNSNTVQPQAVKYYFYIVVGTVSKLAIQVDIDQIATDLNGKAGVDLANINNTAKIAIAHNAMPSGTYDDLTLGAASGSTYTAPADGYFVFSKNAVGAGQYISIVGENLRTDSCSATNNSYGLRVFIPVRKGDIVSVGYSATGATSIFRFVYANGSESEQ